jgi:Zn-dependent protease
MDDIFLIRLGVVALVIYATSLHELAHAVVATKLGDPTPGRHGRLTWNPIPHLTPFFTAVVLPLLLMLTSGTMIAMAYCPVDPTKFRRPLRDYALVAVAGPLTNLAFAGILIGVMWIPGVWHKNQETLLMNITYLGAFYNVILCVFNLLPIPPLDGYAIIRGLIPLETRMKTDSLSRNPLVGMLGVFLVGSLVIGMIHEPLKALFNQLTPNAYRF